MFVLYVDRCFSLVGYASLTGDESQTTSVEAPAKVRIRDEVTGEKRAMDVGRQTEAVNVDDDADGRGQSKAADAK